jgi:dynein heavy chain
MPFSFDIVNKTAATYFTADRRYVYTTPKSYLELLKLYKTLLQRKREESVAAIDRLSNGLRKLKDTAAAVSVIEEELSERGARKEGRPFRAPLPLHPCRGQARRGRGEEDDGRGHRR